MDIFLLGGVLLAFTSVYVIVKKAAVDIYMLNFVMLMTAQYRYVALKLKKIFREGNSQDKYDKKESHPEKDSWAETEMKAICRHFSTVVR